MVSVQALIGVSRLLAQALVAYRVPKKMPVEKQFSAVAVAVGAAASTQRRAREDSAFADNVARASLAAIASRHGLDDARRI